MNSNPTPTPTSPLQSILETDAARLGFSVIHTTVRMAVVAGSAGHRVQYDVCHIPSLGICGIHGGHL
ncbi:hypothetical protein KIPB_015957 [Kipferlia bialata]|uniref:Uncharacterized protein n=1 Tax=Kipferlia bialata TaxID=797122 RepID=A0A391NV03_9EUKA|nr:hypothetical protein KIPB_015957 [Kipferlia bialata]|eukprot:g15957.t1